MAMDSISRDIFKAYDIRGTYPDQLNGAVAKKLGRSFGIFIKDLLKKDNLTIVVGNDSRLSADELKGAFCEGVLGEGVHVIDIGLTTSPMHLYGIIHLHADAGVMITASHNPKEYNGFKFTLQNGESVGYDSGLKDLRVVFDNLVVPGHPVPNGNMTACRVVEVYVDFLARGKKIDSSLKIVADAGNGTAGAVLPKLCERLGIFCTPLFFEPDGNFPHRSPDPTKAGALTHAMRAVVEHNAGLGVVFDADADRAVFVDEKGDEINPNFITAMLAEHFLSSYPNERIWYDAVSSKIVPEIIVAKGGVPVPGMVGRVRAKQAMKDNDCIFGGEHSAHYYYRDYFYSDSALLTLLHVLEILSFKKEKLSEIVSQYAKYAHSGELNFHVSDKAGLLGLLHERYHDGKMSNVDGITVEYEDWWFNVRASNTEPLIRLNLEAENKEILEKEKQNLTELISSFSASDRA